MPGFNKKGPQNMGPMTGRRMGTCMAAQNQTDEKQPADGGFETVNRRFSGFRGPNGRGAGRGNNPQGFCRGRGRRRGFC